MLNQSSPVHGSSTTRSHFFPLNCCSLSASQRKWLISCLFFKHPTAQSQSERHQNSCTRLSPANGTSTSCLANWVTGIYSKLLKRNAAVRVAVVATYRLYKMASLFP